MPQLWIIAGPNGAGKTTISQRLLRKINYQLPVVNPDEIAHQINPLDMDGVRIRAGREAIRRQRQLLATGQDFAIETTLSGQRSTEVIRYAQSIGYKVSLVFVGLENPKLALGRITERIGGGGHHIPPHDAARRFARSMQNLSLVLQVVDRAFLLDNSGPKTRLLCTKEHGALRNVSDHLPLWTQRILLSP